MSNPAARAPRARSGVGTPFLTRAAVFILLLVIAQLWVNRHLGALDLDWLGVGALIAGITAALKLLDRFVEEPERKELQSVGDRVRLGIRWFLLSWPFLALLGTAIVVVLLNWSSILVVGDHGLPLRIDRIARPDGGNPRGIRRTHERTVVPVTPFGRPYWIEVDGYRPRLVLVPPFSGVVLQAGSDLKKTATVLLRLPPGKLAVIENGGRIRIWRGRELLVSAATRQGAWMIGPVIAVTPERENSWRLQLSMQGLSAPVMARALLDWGSPERLGGRIELLPGDTLRAAACSPGGTVIAEGRWQVLEDELSDLQLASVHEPRECKP